VLVSGWELLLMLPPVSSPLGHLLWASLATFTRCPRHSLGLLSRSGLQRSSPRLLARSSLALLRLVEPTWLLFLQVLWLSLLLPSRLGRELPGLLLHLLAGAGPLELLELLDRGLPRRFRGSLLDRALPPRSRGSLSWPSGDLLVLVLLLDLLLWLLDGLSWLLPLVLWPLSGLLWWLGWPSGPTRWVGWLSGPTRWVGWLSGYIGWFDRPSGYLR
jgi:hypothetical protein